MILLKNSPNLKALKVFLVRTAGGSGDLVAKHKRLQNWFIHIGFDHTIHGHSGRLVRTLKVHIGDVFDVAYDQAKRKSASVKPSPRESRGVLAKFPRTVGWASEGAVTR